MEHSRFKLRHLFVLTAWVALGAAAWRLGFPAWVYFFAFSLAGVIAVGVWLERWNAATNTEGQRRSAVIGWIVFVVGGILFSAVASTLLYPLYLEHSRSNDRFPINNIRALGTAVLLYEDQFGPLPRVIYDDNGHPMHSWRVLILPYLEEPKLYKRYRFEEPWDSPHNLKVAEEMPSLFTSWRNRSLPANQTDFLAVYDPMQPNAEVGQLPADAPKLMLVETSASGILWTEPRDLPLDDLSNWQATRSRRGGWIAITRTLMVTFIQPDRNLQEIPP